MRRRDFLRTTTGAAAILAAPLAAPGISRAADNKVLRFVPQANLANLDPIWTTQYVVRNGSLLIWDTLYGVNEKLEPQPQMVEAHETSADGKTWTFKLRTGLKFHDNEPVLAKDVVASINRWMVRDSTMGVPIKRTLDALEAVDDRTFRFRLKAPYPKLLFALGKSSTPVLFIMPERIAATDPFKQIGDYVGSGPMRFKKDEWVPGSGAVFERFAGYEPRAEKANWLSGGKRINFDRIEWKILPDAATASAALQKQRGGLAGNAGARSDPSAEEIRRCRRRYRRSRLGNIGFIPHQPSAYPPFNVMCEHAPRWCSWRSARRRLHARGSRRR